jgi:hypothetical protein
VQRIPRRVAIQSLNVNQTNIILADEDTGLFFDCEVHSSNRNVTDKYIGKCFYDYVREGRLKLGDTLFFVVENPPDRVYVTIISAYIIRSLGFMNIYPSMCSLSYFFFIST